MQLKYPISLSTAQFWVRMDESLIGNLHPLSCDEPFSRVFLKRVMEGNTKPEEARL